MRKITLIIALSTIVFSCKKESKEPEKQMAFIEFYHKKGNFTYNTGDYSGQKQSSNNVEVINVDLSASKANSQILIKNNVKYQNDSMHLKVTFKGKTLQKGANCSNFFVTLQYQLSEFD
jgi:hypothetical protein